MQATLERQLALALLEGSSQISQIGETTSGGSLLCESSNEESVPVASCKFVHLEGCRNDVSSLVGLLRGDKLAIGVLQKQVEHRLKETQILEGRSTEESLFQMEQWLVTGRKINREIVEERSLEATHEMVHIENCKKKQLGRLPIFNFVYHPQDQESVLGRQCC